GGGGLACLQAGQGGGRGAVELDEERVDPGTALIVEAHPNPVKHSLGAVAGPPDDRRGEQLVAGRVVVAATHRLRYQAVAAQHAQQVPDHVLGVARPAQARVLPPQVTAVGGAPGEVQVAALGGALPSGAAERHADGG